MTLRMITIPTAYSPDQLRKIFLATSDAFTEGRRNNDMVNWFLTEQMDGGHYLDGYREAFGKFCQKLSREQFDSLMDWPDDVDRKLQVLYDHYHAVFDPQTITSLWIPMDYEIPDDI